MSKIDYTNYYDLVFVILVYMDVEDLVECIQSVERHCGNYKIIIVSACENASYQKSIKMISDAYSADIIEVPNKGYSYGNNTGIEYALEHYDFRFLIVCNPDVVIEQWDTALCTSGKVVYGPVIFTKNGKAQNPCFPFDFPAMEYVLFILYKYNIPFIPYVIFFANRFLRELFLFYNKLNSNHVLDVYGLHGSFLIFPKEVLLKGKVFLDDMVFFNEERYLAWKQKSNGGMKMVKDIVIMHKEDGEFRFSRLNENQELRNSFFIYWQHKNGFP